MNQDLPLNQDKLLNDVVDTFRVDFSSSIASLFASIPKTEFWRFFIDFNDQDMRESFILASKELEKEDFNLNIDEFLTRHKEWNEFLAKEGYIPEKHRHLRFEEYINLQRGWSSYEDREPGYLLALLTAFNYILASHLGNDPYEPSIKLIQQIHRLATGNVKKTHYDIEHELTGIPGEFRKIQDYTTYQLSSNNMTLTGFYELAQKMKNQHLPLLLLVKNLELKQEDEELPLFSIDMPGPDLFVEIDLNESWEDTEKLKSLLSKIYMRFCDPLEAYEDNLYLGSMLNDNPEEAMAQSLAYLLDVYKYNSYHSATPSDKIKSIISLVQDCDQLHPFIDGNIRSFAVIFLNHLLMMNGFPPTIMDDPNHFDGYSVDELVEEVIRGMNRVLELAKNKIKFQYSTEALLVGLTQEEKEYFDKFTGQVIPFELPVEKSHAPSKGGFFSESGKQPSSPIEDEDYKPWKAKEL